MLRREMILGLASSFPIAQAYGLKGENCVQSDKLLYCESALFAQNNYSKAQEAKNSHSKLTVSVTDKIFEGGAQGNGSTSDLKAFQAAMDFVREAGGGIVLIPDPPKAWMLDYPVFIGSNTEVRGSGKGCKIVFKNPNYSKGRGGFVMGSSLEANRENARNFRSKPNYSSMAIKNPAYRNPARKSYLRDNLEHVEIQGSIIHDVYLVAKFDDPRGWGGYGINFVNALKCQAFNIWGEGWTQLIGMGSDVPPETPSNHLCSAWNLSILAPDPVHTYYAIAFLANSTNCSIRNAKLYTPIVDGTPDGSGIATNFVEDCEITDIEIPKLGRSKTSQGILINNAKGCVVNNIYVGYAKSAVATYYSDEGYNDSRSPNTIGPSITGFKCDRVLDIGARYADIKGYKNEDSEYDIFYRNKRSMENKIVGPNKKIYRNSSW